MRDFKYLTAEHINPSKGKVALKQQVMFDIVQLVFDLKKVDFKVHICRFSVFELVHLGSHYMIVLVCMQITE